MHGPDAAATDGRERRAASPAPLGRLLPELQDAVVAQLPLPVLSAVLRQGVGRHLLQSPSTLRDLLERNGLAPLWLARLRDETLVRHLHVEAGWQARLAAPSHCWRLPPPAKRPRVLGSALAPDGQSVATLHETAQASAAGAGSLQASIAYLGFGAARPLRYWLPPQNVVHLAYAQQGQQIWLHNDAGVHGYILSAQDDGDRPQRLGTLHLGGQQGPLNAAQPGGLFAGRQRPLLWGQSSLGMALWRIPSEAADFWPAQTTPWATLAVADLRHAQLLASDQHLFLTDAFGQGALAALAQDRLVSLGALGRPQRPAAPGSGPRPPAVAQRPREPDTLAYNHDGRLLLFDLRASRAVAVMRFRRPQAPSTSPGHKLTLRGVLATANDSLLFAGSHEGAVVQYDARAPNQAFTWVAPQPRHAGGQQLALRGDGRFLFVLQRPHTQHGTTQLFRLDTQQATFADQRGVLCRQDRHDPWHEFALFPQQTRSMLWGQGGIGPCLVPLPAEG